MIVQVFLNKTFWQNHRVAVISITRVTEMMFYVNLAMFWSKNFDIERFMETI